MSDKVKIIKGNKELRNRVKPIEVGSKLRVAAYTRVSTDQEEQQESLKTQNEHYSQYINSHDNWIFVGIYSDEGISGTQVIKRDGFLKMIEDCRKGKIDLIVTKTISRFARNARDTLSYINDLRDIHVGVFFENEGIDTLDSKYDFLLTILSSTAEQEVKNISANVKAALKHKMENGRMVGFHKCLGYDYDPITKTISINSREAKIVKYIFKRYLEFAGAQTIARELTKKGCKTLKGNDRWCEGSIRRVINNEIYAGILCQGKTYTESPITHKRRKNYGEKNTYVVENHHEPIISVEDFNKAKEICESRAKFKKNGYINPALPFNRQYTFSSLLECGCCGAHYSRRSKKKWHCSNYLKYGLETCNKSKALDEELIESAFVEAFTDLVAKQENGQVLNTFLKEFEKSTKSSGFNGKIRELEKKIAKYIQFEDKLIQLKIDGKIDDESYDRQYKENKSKIEELRVEKSEYQELASNENKITERIDNFRKQLKDINNVNKFDRNVFETLIDKVIVGGYDNNNDYDPFKLTFVFKSDIYSDSSNKLDYTINVRKNKKYPLSKYNTY